MIQGKLDHVLNQQGERASCLLREGLNGPRGQEHLSWSNFREDAEVPVKRLYEFLVHFQGVTGRVRIGMAAPKGVQYVSRESKSVLPFCSRVI